MIEAGMRHVTPAVLTVFYRALQQALAFARERDFWTDHALAAKYIGAAITSRELLEAWEYRISRSPRCVAAISQALQHRMSITTQQEQALQQLVQNDPAIKREMTIQVCAFVEDLLREYPQLKVINIAGLWLSVRAGIPEDYAGFWFPEDFLPACREQVLNACCWRVLGPQVSTRRILG